MMQLGNNGLCAREYMTIRSYVLNTYSDFDDLMLISPTVLFCNYFDYCIHKQNISQLDAFKTTTLFYPDNKEELLHALTLFFGKRFQPVVVGFDLKI